MGIYGNEKDYEELVKENIKRARLLYHLSENDKNYVIRLLIKKEKIKEKNGFWANFQINRLNKKIEKIKNRYNS